MIRPSRIAMLTLLLVSGAVACSEPTDPVPPKPRETTPPPPPPPAPVLRVGAADAILVLPRDTAELRGWLHGPATWDIQSYSWKWAAGPTSYSLLDPDSLAARVTNLEYGFYEFELTVRDRFGQTATAMAGVLVYDSRVEASNEFVHRNLQWQCPMGCYIELGDVRQYTANGGALRVFVQQGAADWVEAAPDHERLENDRKSDVAWWMGSRRLWLWLYGEEPTSPVSVNVLIHY